MFLRALRRTPGPRCRTGPAAAEGGEGVAKDAIVCLHASSCETVRRALNRLIDMRNRLQTLSASQMSLILSSHLARGLNHGEEIEAAIAQIDSRIGAIY